MTITDVFPRLIRLFPVALQPNGPHGPFDHSPYLKTMQIIANRAYLDEVKSFVNRVVQSLVIMRMICSKSFQTTFSCVEMQTPNHNISNPDCLHVSIVR